ncbi:hypothetical protein H257_09316 [Aphanomyces astaci]|uniref:Transposase Tc1-like domain-containing protein n=1 Tax=Aphanomyces astaci TaxID=112090 RepID=W4GD35_APHAT|nr:hypothetical protein H257_09316 [Aphanomyces astaci]ETV76878.1 hypothetical protein H257_09316 [Aphanomyces astaci]|eukprot:XP_009833790.1 hypothetical protein H257_09316 [Aphanomyces astaci]
MPVKGRLPHGAFQKLCTVYGCHWRTVSRIWTRAVDSLAQGAGIADTAAKIVGNSGRKLTRRHDDIEAAIRSVPHHQRQTLRSVAAHSGIPKTSIVRHMKAVTRLKARSSYVKPYLTEANQHLHKIIDG